MLTRGLFTRLLRHTAAAVLTLLFGILVVAGMGAVLAKYAPNGADDLHAYETAARCPQNPASPADCRWTREYTVTRAHVSNSRHDDTYALLTSENGVVRKTVYPNDGPVVDRLRTGDRVTVTVWRGLLTEIAAHGKTQRTSAAPANMRARLLIYALMAIPAGLLVIAVAVWRLSRGTVTLGMAATLALALAWFFAGFFSPLLLVLIGHTEEVFWHVAAIWLPAAILLTAGARYYVVQQRALAG
ncbi:hypothetical protein J4573_14630 [Actinomadura barringtoniae]|uniref:Uncharacterized protein n=1 Tax=Actinomadura barringtoniae TaxID=1427535 RepID=A0A939PDY9_9ACTN|nr:hypothetical protein [Actinomadura barringtoniae]MBO2448338.1 hypothetical protein [Actinomadura barringtoniae]